MIGPLDRADPELAHGLKVVGYVPLYLSAGSANGLT